MVIGDYKSRTVGRILRKWNRMGYRMNNRFLIRNVSPRKGLQEGKVLRTEIGWEMKAPACTSGTSNAWTRPIQREMSS